MIRALQVGDRGTPRIGPGLLAELKARGVQGIRTDCQRLGAEETFARCQEIADAGLIPLATVYNYEDSRLLRAGSHVEFRNETNIGHGAGFLDRDPIPPAVYRDLLLQFHRASVILGHVILASGVANFNREGVAYMAALGVDSWPADICVALHFYPHGDSPTVPHPGFGSREAAVAAMRSHIKKRQWAVTEFGYHTANRARWWEFRRRRWTDAQVAQFVAWEWQFWEGFGATGAVLYQINDGPRDTKEERYGVRRFDPTGAYSPSIWKPVMDTFSQGA